jgi:general secretion pathway protein G
VTNKAEVRSQKSEVRSRKDSLFPASANGFLPSDSSGFSLIELVITITVLGILTLGTVPLVQVAAQRQKEQELREALRTMREAIDQFHREALAGAQVQINQQQTGGRPAPNPNPTPQNNPLLNDSRVRVAITDQTIFTADNPDRYPPDLDTLVKGVDVIPLASTLQPLGGGGLNGTKGPLEQNDSLIPKTKVYLRSIPVDPMTGKAEWDVRSCYDLSDSTSTGGENVFDVHSKSKGTALNGKEKYNEW